MDVGIERLKVRNGLLVDLGLGLVGVVLGPEADLILPGAVKALRHDKVVIAARAVAGRERQQAQRAQQRAEDAFPSFHPLVPPLETPAMIFLRKSRNSTISGTEITTTAAIMAGMFSRPKPFSRIDWMPLETRK